MLEIRALETSAWILLGRRGPNRALLGILFPTGLNSTREGLLIHTLTLLGFIHLDTRWKRTQLIETDHLEGVGNQQFTGSVVQD